jgi:hypothetical protein
MSGQSISYSIGRALPVHNFILQSHQLSEHLLLPMCMQSLVRQMDQTFLVSDSEKLS